MRAVIQRVKEAKVVVHNQTVGSIEKGLCILIGFENFETDEDLKWMVSKVVNMRIFNDSEGKMNYSLEEIKGEILVISQFTLHAKTKKGNRPSFINSAKADEAELLYENFKKLISAALKKEIQTGIFGADMQVFLVNDGPVTIVIDSKNKEI